MQGSNFSIKIKYCSNFAIKCQVVHGPLGHQTTGGSHYNMLDYTIILTYKMWIGFLVLITLLIVLNPFLAFKCC